MTKVLILVGCVKQWERDRALMKGQRETWGSIPDSDVKTLYVYGERYGNIEEDEYCSYTGDQYHFMHIKVIKALELIYYWDWDYIMCTTVASYIDKRRLKEFCNTLPKDKVYCGLDEKTFVSGCGIIFSKDVIKIFIDNAPSTPHDASDVLLSQILFAEGIKVTDGAKRVDYYGYDFEKLYCIGKEKTRIDNPLIPCYHYRCKHPLMDYNKELESFYDIFNFLNPI